MLDLAYDVEHWSLAVTLCVLILADQALRTVGREPGPPPFIQRLSDGFLVVSGLWGAYFAVSTVFFLHNFWKGLLNDAGPVVVFVTLVALAAGLWLAGVGISRSVALLRSGGDASPLRVRSRRAAWITMFLAAAWFICCCLVFSAMYAYVYLSTLGLLFLGFYGTSDAVTKLLKDTGSDRRCAVGLARTLRIHRCLLSVFLRRELDNRHSTVSCVHLIRSRRRAAALQPMSSCPVGVFYHGNLRGDLAGI